MRQSSTASLPLLSEMPGIERRPSPTRAACHPASQALAPAGRASLFQGIVEAVHWGVGFGGGAAVGGLLFAKLGPLWTFRGAAAVSVGMGALCCFLQYGERSEQSERAGCWQRTASRSAKFRRRYATSLVTTPKARNERKER